jgi:hypothetical protein
MELFSYKASTLILAQARCRTRSRDGTQVLQFSCTDVAPRAHTASYQRNTPAQIKLSIMNQ